MISPLSQSLARRTRAHSTSYSSVVLADSPVGYWRLGEASGTTANDSSGNGWNGTYSGSPLPTLGAAGLLTGDPNTAANFTNVNQYIAPTLFFNVGTISIEAWFNLASLPSAGIRRQIASRAIGIGSGTADTTLAIDSSGVLSWFCYDGTSRVISASVSAGVTYHVVGTADGTNQNLYLNGSLASSGPCGNVYTGYSGPNFFISGSQSGSLSAQGFLGVIDEAAIYATALSAARVAAHYAAGI